MTKSPGIALYNQDRFDDADFVTHFVARNDLVQALLATLRSIAAGGPTEHQILVGARGMGKTSLLRRLAIAVIDDGDLDAAFIPLRFREEQYNIISLDAFWRNCGESLAEYCEQRGNQALADQLDVAIETPEWRDADTARDAFLAACRSVGGRAILLLDNLDLILDGLKDEGCWSLRAALQRINGPIVIGAATQLLGQGSNRDAPFYEFFNPHMLEPLTERDLLACLNALADRRGAAGAPVKAVLAREPERVRALYVLTGGNPRVLAIVYQLLEQADSDTIFADLEALLDQVTPFYKARIEEYQTPLQRAVIDGIALNWDPITSATLSKATGIEATTLSAQLGRLRKDGLIEEVRTSGTRAGYQLAERFLNIWYLMRHGTRKTKQRLRWFTIFLTKLFSAEDLQRMAGDARNGAARRWHPDHCEAVIEAYEIKRQSEVPQRRSAANELFMAALKLDAEGRSDDEIAIYDEIVARFGDSDAAALKVPVAKALFNKGVRLGKLGRSEDAIAAYDEVVARFGSSDATELQESAARALFNKGITLGKLGRTEDEIAVYDEVVTCFGESDAADVQRQVSMALVNKGITLGTLGRSEDEIAVYDEVVARFGESDAADVQRQVAMAFVNKGVSLGKMGRSEDEIAVYDEAIARFGESDAAGLQESAAMALVNKGITLGTLGRAEDEMAVYDEAIARFGESDAADLQRQVAMALVNKGVALGAWGRAEDEIAVYDEVVARFGDSDATELQESVAMALVHKGITLGTLGAAEDAIAVYHEVVARFGSSESSDLQEQVENALVKIGTLLFWDFGREQDGLAKLRQAMTPGRDDSFARANLFWMTVASGQATEAKALLDALDTITDGGRALMLAALDLIADNFGSSLAHLADALDQGLSGRFDYSEDLLWYLRIAARRGHGERLIGWFGDSGNAERYAPVYGAFVAHVRGAQFLLDLNPEVRGVAKPLYARMSAGKREGAATAKPRSLRNKSSRGHRPR